VDGKGKKNSLKIVLKGVKIAFLSSVVPNLEKKNLFDWWEFAEENFCQSSEQS
jgi:hypothetical protein